MSCASSPHNRFGNVLIAAVAAFLLAGCDSAEAEMPATAVKAGAQTTIATVDPIDLERLVASGKARLIDVRTDEEVAEGVIPGAEHIALDRFDPAKLDLSDGREPVLYCRSGRRSEQAAQRLSEFTGKPARHLDGGINAWRDAGLPIISPTLF